MRHVSSSSKSLVIKRSAILSSIVLSGFLANGASGGIIGNDGFESPNLGGGGFEYSPAGTAWNFSRQNGGTGTGIAANNSPFNVQNATNGNSDGTTSSGGQAGFIQKGDGTIGNPNSAVISQTVTLAAGTYNFSVDTEARTGGISANPLTAFLYDATLTTAYLDLNFAPTSTTSFNEVTASFSIPSAGQYGLYFVGDGNGGNDVSSFIDNVEITVPEPASLGVLTVIGAALFSRRRRQGHRAG